MAKIKNDPRRYVTRASLGSIRSANGTLPVQPASTRTMQDFRDADVDDRLYVTFKRREKGADA